MGSLSQVQRDVIVGSLLGDGTLRKQGNRTYPLFEVNHAERYRAYVDWKYEILRNLVSTPPKARRGNGFRVAYRFTTRSLPEFDEYYRQFYPAKHKMLPKYIRLTPRALATWFMDDGSKSWNALYLNTQQFTYGEQIQLLHTLQSQWRFYGSLNRDKEYFRVRLSVESSKRFKEIVRPYILPLFHYKLGDDPVTTSADALTVHASLYAKIQER